MAETFVANESIETVIQRYKGTVYSVALSYVKNREDADDIFQEVFLIYFRTKPEFNDEEHRKAWLIRCTVNRASNLHTSAFRRHTVPLETAAHVGVEDDHCEVYSAVLSLPAKYRAVIHLHYFEGLSVAEIAAALGAAEGTVMSLLSRGRALLRESLKEAVNL